MSSRLSDGNVLRKQNATPFSANCFSILARVEVYFLQIGQLVLVSATTVAVLSLADAKSNSRPSTPVPFSAGYNSPTRRLDGLIGWGETRTDSSSGSWAEMLIPKSVARPRPRATSGNLNFENLNSLSIIFFERCLKTLI